MTAGRDKLVPGETEGTSRRRPAILAVAIGLALALLTLFLAVMLAGAGHGWSAPLLFSLPVIVLYPAAFFLAILRSGFARGGGLLVVAAGFILDLALVMVTSANQSEDFFAVLELGPEVVTAWVFLWFVWQAAALVAVVREDEQGG